MLSVIMPAYNRAATLPLAIASLLAQRADAGLAEIGLDIVVVDDGSQDETPQVLAELASRHPEIRVLRQDNAGVSAARNAGLAALLPETTLVSFLDSDDISPAGRFAADLPLFAADPDLALTYGRMMQVDAIDPAAMAPAEGARQADICSIQLACAIYRRALIDRIGFFDAVLRQAEDTDYLLRTFEIDASWRQTDTLCVYYLRHPGNITRDRAEMRRGFAAAVVRSLRRRRADPSLRLKTPAFDAQELIEMGLF